MKRILALVLCLILMCSCACAALAAPVDPTGDPTEVNTGPAAGNAFLIFVIVLGVVCAIYLFIKFRK